jgi:superfamily I DNA/RNA helicase
LVRSVTDWLDAHADPELGDREGWGAWIVSVSGDGFIPALSAELQQLLTALDELTEASTLERYLGQLMPLAKDYALANAAGVRIMTMSGSMGLTARAAIIAGVEEGIIPLPNALLAEERRLLYVAMTRAREYSFCTWAQQRTGPTARAGRPRVGGRRTYSTLLEPGRVRSQSGPAYLEARWPEE